MASMLQGAGAFGTYKDWQFGFYGEDQFRFRPNLTFELGFTLGTELSSGCGRRACGHFRRRTAEHRLSQMHRRGLSFPGIGGRRWADADHLWLLAAACRCSRGNRTRFPAPTFHVGFGLFTAPQIISTDDHTTENSPFAPTFALNGTPTTPLPLNNPWAGFAGTAGKSPFPPFASSAYRPPSSVAFTPGLSIADGIDPNARLGITQAWNVAAEQQLGSNYDGPGSPT